MKKYVAFLLIFSCLLSGCRKTQREPYTYVDYTLFDTVTTILGYGESEEAFRVQAEKICRELETYHRLFDIYEDYEGIHNLKTVNDRAGMEPVSVELPILELLQDCREYEALSGGDVNVGMGSLLSLWHGARDQAEKNPEKAAIPELGLRQQAKKHRDLQNLVLDFEKSTVFLKDPEMKLDVGAVAKGWAARKVSEQAPAGMLISVGGNVCATGPKPDGSPWVVGIQNPDGQGYLRTVELRQGAVVTSGDYQRFFTVEGKRYHHIIDPETTMPAEQWRSVTVVCPDSGLADALSTALFVKSLEEGQEILRKTGAEALWMDLEGKTFVSPGFPEN